MVSLYFAYNKTELEQIKMLARRTRCLQISVSTSEHLIKSCNRQCCLVLPKNIWDVDLSRLPTDRRVSWHIKYHPASNIWQKLIWSLIHDCNAFNSDGGQTAKSKTENVQLF